jgi:hypothetical protein
MLELRPKWSRTETPFAKTLEKTLAEDPNLATFRTDMAEATVRKSSTESWLPIVECTRNAERLLPRREHARTLRQDPIEISDKMDQLPPPRTRPQTERPEPNRAMERTEKVEAVSILSSKLKDDPSVETPYRLSELPILQKLRTDRLDPR